MNLTVIVHGRPAPQGSKRVMRNGAVVEQSRHLPPWRVAVCEATVKAREEQGFSPDPTAAYNVYVIFTVRRPAAHWRHTKAGAELKANAPTHPAVQPDLDKLVRAVLDGLADGGALTNDARVVALVAAKTYPAGHLDALDEPGAVITVHPVI